MSQFAFARLGITQAEYIALVDWTGRQLHPGKRGKISASEPPALRKLGLDSAHWTMKVKGIGSGYWRAVGTADTRRSDTHAPVRIALQEVPKPAYSQPACA